MTSREKMLSYFRLFRPSNFLIAVLSIFVACILAGGSTQNLWTMIAASLGGGLIGAGGMVINDLFDIEIDRINRPERPLPSGALSRREAGIAYVLLSLSGILLNMFTTPLALAIAVAAVPLVFLYSAYLKRMPLLGNILVAFMTGLAFLYGGAAAGRMEATVMPAIFAFLINAAREIVKDMEDRDGDAQLGARTFPIVYGMRASSMMASILLVALIIATVVPFWLGIYGLRYFILVNAGVNTVLLYVLWHVRRDQSAASLHRLSVLLKYDMLIGLLAVYSG